MPEKDKKLPFEILDLTETSPREVLERLTKETHDDFVLHGSNNPEILSMLDARPANDVIRDTGRKTAIYATTKIESAIHRAIVNRRYLNEKLDSKYIIGWDFRENGQMVFKASPSVYELFQTNYEDIFSDGLIYSFTRDGFERNVGQEYVSHVSQTPARVFKVPASLSKELFVIGDTIVPYTEEELVSFGFRN